MTQPTIQRADGRRQHAVAEDVVAVVPLQVPDHEAGPAERLDPEHLGRPVGALPVEGQRHAGEGGGEEGREEIGDPGGATPFGGRRG